LLNVVPNHKSDRSAVTIYNHTIALLRLHRRSKNTTVRTPQMQYILKL